MRISLKTKAVALFSAMVIAPVVLAVAALIDVNRRPIQESETQLQAAVAAEVASGAAQILHAFEADANSIAAVLAQAAGGSLKDEDAIQAVQALIATSDAVHAVRFEVPSASVSAVIKRSGGADAAVPASTPELRAAADSPAGFGFARTSPTSGVLVVPIPTRSGNGSARGYVTVEVGLSAIRAVVDRAALVRFSQRKVSLLVADEDRRAVASFGIDGAEPGADVSSLPIWKPLSEGHRWRTRFSVVTEHEQDGTPMVGTVESIPEYGFAVAIWRPKPVAFAALADMRRRGLQVALVAAAVALLIGYAAAHGVTRPIRQIVAQARLIGRRKWNEIRLPKPRNDEIGELTEELAQMATDLERGEDEIVREAKLRGDLSRFMSKELVDAIVRGEHPVALGGRRASVTVIFADVVAFTALAEAKPAEQVVTLLNELFSVLSEVVFRHGGTVDKFIGDCLMAVFGAPVAHADHAARALAAAEDMMRFLDTANEGFLAKYGAEVRLGIGINSGEAIVGNIGSDKRMEYTVIGDVVNVAARLEAIAAPNEVLVADATHALAGEDFELVYLGERTLTGRKKATGVYRMETG
jgi:class 3 adenylate cyclase